MSRNTCPHACRTLFAGFALVFLSAAAGATGETPIAALPATWPVEPTTQSLVEAVVRHPRDEKRWEPLRDPAHREEAKKLLLAAFRDPANARQGEWAVIRPEGGRDEILRAIAGAFEDDAADVLLEGAKDADPEVREAAVGLMGWRIKTPNPQIKTAIRNALRDPDAQVAIAALGAIRSSPDSEAGPAVLELLIDPPVRKRKAWDRPSTWNVGDFAGYTPRDGFDEALDAIGATGYPGALDELSTLARDPSAYVRSRAGKAMAQCAARAEPVKRAAAVKLLVSMLADPNPGVCVEAAEALAHLGDSSGAAVLVFELKKATRPIEKDGGNDRDFALPVVQALEKLTGEDFGSSLGNEFWIFDHQNEDEHVRKLEAVQPRVKSILERIAAKGLKTDGFPAFPEKLTDAEKAMFDRAFDNWLVDPRGGQWVSFDYDLRTAWARTEKVHRFGWLFPAQGDQPARILLNDRAVLPAPKDSTPEDLVAA